MQTSSKRLELIRAANLILQADRSLEDVDRTRFEGRPPVVREEGDTVTLEYPGSASAGADRIAPPSR